MQVCSQLRHLSVHLDLHSRGPVHEGADQSGVHGEHEQQEDGLVQVVELDEGGQRENRHDPQMDQVLRGILVI